MINSGDLWIYTDFIKAMIELHHDNYYSHSELSFDDIFIVIERVEHAHGNYIKILCKSGVFLMWALDIKSAKQVS